MKRLIRTGFIVLAGLMFVNATGIGDVTGSPLYLYTVTTLLAIGLYTSASGIPREAVRDLRTVLTAVTLGIFFKATLIAGVMYLVTLDPLALVLGIAVAQIDPLSVAAMAGSSRMSPRGKAVLLAWASFDDPVTALLLVYLSAFTLRLRGDSGQIIGAPAGADLTSYLLNFAANLAFAAGCLLVWLLVREAGRRWGRKGPPRRAGTVAAVVVLALLIAFAVYNFLMLGIALVGLFFRPRAERLISGATGVAFTLATFALGMLLIGGIDIGLGLVLGCAAFGSQIIAALAIARRLPRADRGYLALGQQNGITAIVLSLTLEPTFPGTVAIVAPAILTVNLIHLVTNEWWAHRLAAPVATVPPLHPDLRVAALAPVQEGEPLR